MDTHEELASAGDENGIDLIILIGDKPANTRAETDERYGQPSSRPAGTIGECFPENTPVYFEDELERLQKSKIPLVAFYVGESYEYYNTNTEFQRYAKGTGEGQNKGASGFLDVNASNAHEVVFKSITEKVLSAYARNDNTKRSKLLQAFADYEKGYSQS